MMFSDIPGVPMTLSIPDEIIKMAVVCLLRFC